jgi:prolipoprotein diacylglyceryl transferase
LGAPARCLGSTPLPLDPLLTPPTVLLPVFSSIPSPSSNRIGPFTAYGLMIAIGVIAAVWLARVRWRQRGGDPDDITSIALWAVPAGLIGARLYHVITDNELYRGHWFDNPFGSEASPWAVWKGGLGIPGGIIVGVGVGLYVAHRRGLRLGAGLDAVAPALPLAQAIGRLGNYFNQELFGRPTDLPWGLQIDPAHRPPEFINSPTFHPTFLYESLWNLALMGVLIWLDKKRVLRPGRVFVVYLGGYFLGRLWVEALRSDSANLILGLRVNIWTSLIAIAGSVVFLLVGGVKRRPDDSDEPYRDGHRFAAPDGTTDAAEPDRSSEPSATAASDEVPGTTDAADESSTA